jgi:VanZ family protein
MSEETYETVHTAIRKCAHFTEYAILGFLTWRLVHLDSAFLAFSQCKQYWLAILLCALYASTDEFHQKFVPDRHPAVLDVMLDTFGAACGVLAIWTARRLRKER